MDQNHELHLNANSISDLRKMPDVLMKKYRLSADLSDDTCCRNPLLIFQTWKRKQSDIDDRME
jgi:hypothetical protein